MQILSRNLSELEQKNCRMKLVSKSPHVVKTIYIETNIFGFRHQIVSQLAIFSSESILELDTGDHRRQYVKINLTSWVSLPKLKNLIILLSKINQVLGDKCIFTEIEILSLSGLTWLTSVDQALEKTESPSAREVTKCCNTRFSVGFEFHFSIFLDVTISASLVTGILRTEIQQNEYLICKF